MATYREIRGLRVPYLSSDLPSASASTDEAQIWYNSDKGKLRAFVAFDTVATAPDMLKNRAKHASAGIQTAAILFGGLAGPSMNLAGGQASEEYNGSGFAAGPDIVNDRQMFAGCGTTAATLGAGGYPVPDHGTDTEEYNGTSWSETANLGTARYGPGVTGTQTAALCITGNAYPNPLKTEVEQYDGSSWSEIDDISTARRNGAAAGTTTSAIYFGGNKAPGAGTKTGETEEWNGTAWSEEGDMNTARETYNAGDGTSTAARTYQGYTTAQLAVVEAWDGTSWTETTDTPTAHWGNSACGTLPAAIITGGYKPPGNTADAEAYEYNHAIVTYTPAAWASATAANTARRNAGGLGTQTAAMVIGGYPNPKVIVEEYNGTSWTETHEINTQRYGGMGHGTTEASLLSGGNNGTVNSALVEEYNGSSWTEVTETPSVKANHMSAGTQTSGLVGLGENATANINTSMEYDGTNWTDGNDANTSRSQVAGCGSQTAAIAMGGSTPGAVANSEEYDGTNWTEGNDLNVAKKGAVGCGFGTQTDAVLTGCGPGPAANTTNTTEIYNGTSWYTSAATMGTARYSHADAGSSTSTAGLIVAGGNTSGSEVANCEELAGETTAAEAVDVDFD